MYHLDRLLIDAEVLIEHFSQLDRPHSPFFFTPSSPSLETENVLFNTFALGGTFNHLHSGHKILPTMVAWLTTHRLIVWITGQSPVSSILLFLPNIYTPWGGFLENPPSKRMDSVPSARNLVAKHPTDAWAARALFGRFRKRPRDARQARPSRGWCTARCPSDT
ncbi:hypothetical protein PGTUg99_023754 [Puccinia graminis f. sp. tritici]|uniref:Cytidyltransferase-like domain-containing protein n=1 Tax=Puccinia graminis f. sp. tritici TaxID=56615 RepID=A0A5B0QKR0_PUCGR|nr:hypothetical protein PGTUg99_023754 [Puccinia graminis f. sp. tritici]